VIGVEVKIGVAVQVVSVGPYKLNVTVPPALVTVRFFTSCDVPVSVAVSVMADPVWAFVAVVTIVGDATSGKQFGLDCHVAWAMTAVWNEEART
jgi:hypothetical protein